jgi:hypothetical protein
MNTERAKRFFKAYAIVAVAYWLFDGLYMSWLALKFGNWVSVPLYFSILAANFGGLYLYNWLGEDVLFMEFGSNWIENGKRFNSFRNLVKRSPKLTYIGLSIWPSPIGSYLFFRKSKEEKWYKILGNMAIGSIFCTIVWGGLLTILWNIVIRVFKVL